MPVAVPGGRRALQAAGLAALYYGPRGRLSGSGSTVLAFAPEEHARKIVATMRTAFEGRGVDAKAWALGVGLSGARVERPWEVSLQLRARSLVSF